MAQLFGGGRGRARPAVGAGRRVSGAHRRAGAAVVRLHSGLCGGQDQAPELGRPRRPAERFERCGVGDPAAGIDRSETHKEASFRAALIRARLLEADIAAIGVSLRHGLITPKQALMALQELGIPTVFDIGTRPGDTWSLTPNSGADVG